MLLTATPKVPGLDGRKMSKSYGNTIGLREDPDSIVKKIKAMQTDPARVRRTDPGDPEKCPVWDLHKLYSNADTQAWVQQGCRTAGIGCLECKAPLIDKIVEEVSAISKRAQEFEENPELVRGIIAEGCERARGAARDTLEAVRQAMGMNYQMKPELTLVHNSRGDAAGARPRSLRRVKCRLRSSRVSRSPRCRGICTSRRRRWRYFSRRSKARSTCCCT